MSGAQPLLHGSRMLVVGGGGVGNGRGIAFGVAAAGARVAIADLDVDRAREVAQKITERGGEAHPLRCDVLVPEDIERVTAETVNALGGLDSVVTVVGGYSLFTPWTPVAEVTDDQWNLIMNLNLTYVFRFVRAAVKVFDAQATGGLDRCGRLDFGQRQQPVRAGVRRRQGRAGEPGEVGVRRVRRPRHQDERSVLRCHRNRGAAGELSQRGRHPAARARRPGRSPRGDRLGRGLSRVAVGIVCQRPEPRRGRFADQSLSITPARRPAERRRLVPR